ncbi:protein NipSnap homolog 3A isoform X1 [Vanacampus margaritifer]
MIHNNTFATLPVNNIRPPSKTIRQTRVSPLSECWRIFGRELSSTFLHQLFLALFLFFLFGKMTRLSRCARLLARFRLSPDVHRSAGLSTGAREGGGALYEFRTYQIRPDRSSAFLKLTHEKIHLRTAHSELIGYWSVEYGALNQVFHIWKYDSFSHRAAVRAALAQDERWIGEYVSQAIPMLTCQDNHVAALLPWSRITAPPHAGGRPRRVTPSLTSPHHVAPRHATSHHATPRHATSHHVTSHHVTSRHVTPRHITPRHATPHHVTPRHIMPRHATPRHITLRHITPRHVTSRHVTSRHVTPRHATPRHATPRHVTSRHVTSRHVTSRHVTPRHVTSALTRGALMPELIWSTRRA